MISLGCRDLTQTHTNEKYLQIRGIKKMLNTDRSKKREAVAQHYHEKNGEKLNSTVEILNSVER